MYVSPLQQWLHKRTSMLHHVYIACLDNVKNGKYFWVCDSFEVKEATYTNTRTVRNPFKILTAINGYLFMPTHMVSRSTRMLQTAQFAGHTHNNFTINGTLKYQ
jgi:hypothetical protein